LKIYEYEYGKVPPTLPPSVLALGFFDGVHIAHRELIRLARKEATRLSLPLYIFTFPIGADMKKGAPRLTDEKKRLSLLGELGPDGAILCDFASVKKLSAEVFVREVLVGAMKAEVAVSGYNFRFGSGASAGADELSRLMDAEGKRALIVREFALDGVAVSSTLIRSYIAEGKMKEAERLLGYPFSVTARVGAGKSLGRQLGYPTVNLSFPEGTVTPRRGVYKSCALIGDRVYPAISNVGSCPTFGEREIHQESFIIGFSGDLYGEQITVELLEFLRDERRFESAEALKMQIKIDIERTIKENY